MTGAGLLQSVLCRHWLHRPALELWQDSATVAAWVQVEQALASVQAQVGLIPQSAATAIAAIDADHIDWTRLEADIAAQMHPFTPVLHQLEQLCSDDAAGYLHWGATTQNIFDTASALQLQRTHAIIDAKLEQALTRMASLAQTHRATLQAGRTHGQHALPITFGLKVAGWHAEIERHRRRLHEAAEADLVAQMGGAVGSFSAMEGKGQEVQQRLAQVLGLRDGGIPARSMVDRIAHFGSLLALMGNTIEKIAREVVFMQRTEVGEAFEAHRVGKIGSSTMAQKRNPSHALNLIGLAYRLRASSHLLQDAMVCENEGFASQANLTDVTIAEAAVCAASLAAGLTILIEGLVVNPDAMRRNLDQTRGLIMSEALTMRLARLIGRHRAHQVLYEVAHAVNDGGKTLAQALNEHPLISNFIDQVDIDYLTDPANYVGESMALVDGQVGTLVQATSSEPASG